MSTAVETPRKVGVVGAGQMGAGIAEVCARAGLDVVVCEAGPEQAAAAWARIEGSLSRAARKGKLTSETHQRALDHLRVAHDLGELADRDLVIEAVVEDAATKLALMERLDALVGPETVLASNTSSIPIIDLGMATGRPDKVVGMHFFNPVPVLPLVEVVTSLKTSEQTVETVTALAAGPLGKQVVKSQDRAGFIVNTLLVPYLLSAIRMLESGFATAEDIDAAMRLGCAHPMGPLELADLIGLDTTKAIAESLYEEFKEPTYAAPALLLRKVRAQELGRKSGRGFFAYDD
ncbi:MAG: 3-hydroxybutyryl-CoA dehydrogenase [Nocardioidaceae bacterium]|nr:3-hydroxybutyryl-CoA dehydrogenase [Nocardioidaceae bacterium]